MTMIEYLFIFLAPFAVYVGSTSNNTLQLPITITPLLQDSVERDDFTNSLIQRNETFFKHVTFSDMVKSLGLTSRPQLEKHLKALVVLGLAAMDNGLTVEKFEFLTPSKWKINVTVEELANVSKNITLPLNEETPLETIQEAMFKILEKRFHFNTEEVAERLNTTVDEVYAFLEPGWIKVVNFITEKNILTLSKNYIISPLYIAEALNMSLPEFYNSTLPQLENILTNKIDVIKEAAERLRRSSSIAALQRISSTFNNVVATSMSISINRTVKTEKTARMTEQPSSITQPEAKTSISNSMSSHDKSSANVLPPSSSMADFPSSKVMTMEIQSTISSFTNTESTFQPLSQKSTLEPSLTPSSSSSVTSLPSPSSTATQVSAASSPSLPQTTLELSLSTTPEASAVLVKSPTPLPTESRALLPTTSKTQPILSTMYHTSVSKTISSERPQGQSFATLQTDMMSHPVTNQRSTNDQPTSMFQQPTTNHVLPARTQVVSTINSKSSLLLKSSKMEQKATTLPISASTTATFVATAESTASKDLRTTMVKSTKNSSLGSTVSSYDMTATKRVDAVKSSSRTEITSALVIATSFLPTSSSNQMISTETPKLHTTSKFTRITEYDMKSSYFSRNSQTLSSQEHSSHFVLRSTATTTQLSTNSRYKQFVNSLESSTRLKSSAYGLVSRKPVVTLRLSSYHATLSSSHVQVIATSSTPILGNTANSETEDEIDPVVVIVIPIMAVLFLAAIILAFVMWMRHRRKRRRAEQKNAENGLELSRKGLVESLENINNNRTTGFANRGSDDRSSRSMSRTSSISNLETIHEGNEPEEPEIYDL